MGKLRYNSTILGLTALTIVCIVASMPASVHVIGSIHSADRLATLALVLLLEVGLVATHLLSIYVQPQHRYSLVRISYGFLLINGISNTIVALTWGDVSQIPSIIALTHIPNVGYVMAAISYGGLLPLVTGILLHILTSELEYKKQPGVYSERKRRNTTLGDIEDAMYILDDTRYKLLETGIIKPTDKSVANVEDVLVYLRQGVSKSTAAQYIRSKDGKNVSQSTVDEAWSIYNKNGVHK